MPKLSQGLTLPRLQSYVKLAAIERGFSEESIPQKFMLLQEELGEAVKAVRKLSGIKIHEESKARSIEDEFADMLFLILDISNSLDVDLEKAFTAKEAINAKRNWR